MSIVPELLERLAGVAVLRSKLAETADRVDQQGAWLLELDRRMTRLEAIAAISRRPPRLPRG